MSPDGREITFHSWRSGSRDIYVLPVDGGPVQQVTSSPLQESAPSWSPDGTALTFAMFGDPGGVWVVQRNAARVWSRPVERTAVGTSPSWSPDGRWIAYTTSLFGGSLAIIPPDSGTPRIVLDPAATRGPRVEQPFWSSDSRTIYFKSHDPQGNAAFWSISVTGGQPKLLTRFTDPLRPSYRPLWGLGPGRMYFTIDERQSEVWVMEATPR